MIVRYIFDMKIIRTVKRICGGIIRGSFRGIFRFLRRRKFLSVLLLLSCLLVYSMVEPHMVSIDTLRFSHPDIPKVFDGFKIAFISDIHAGKYYSRTRLEGLVQRINEIAPDLVLLGGDFVHGDSESIPWCFAALSGLEAPSGVMGVLGNHDNWAGGALVKKAMRDNGIFVLDNTSVWVYRQDDRIKIGGVADLQTDFQDLKETTADLETGDFALLVSHNPDFADTLTNDKIDLMLSGHTHGGQLTFFGLYAPVLPTASGQKYRSGLVRAEHTSVYISRGIGTITPPLRFFAPPEISVIVLQTEEN